MPPLSSSISSTTNIAARLQNIRILSLDAMNTLIRLRESPAAMYTRMARTEPGIDTSKMLGEQQMQAHFRQAFKQLEMERPCYAYGETTGSGGADGYRSWWTELIRRTFGPNVEIPTTFANRLIDLYCTPEIWAFTEDELLGTLQQLRAQCPSIHVVITSNFDTRLRKILAQLGIGSDKQRQLLPVIDEFFLSGEMGIAKPDRRIFTHILRHFRMEQQPEVLLHVGDSARKDVWAAKQLGANGMLYRPDGVKKPEDDEYGVRPDECVPSMVELLRVLIKQQQNSK